MNINIQRKGGRHGTKHLSLVPLMWSDDHLSKGHILVSE